MAASHKKTYFHVQKGNKSVWKLKLTSENWSIGILALTALKAVL